MRKPFAVSRPCARPACGTVFVADQPDVIYCTGRCGQRHRRAVLFRRRLERAGIQHPFPRDDRGRWINPARPRTPTPSRAA